MIIIFNYNKNLPKIAKKTERPIREMGHPPYLLIFIGIKIGGNLKFYLNARSVERSRDSNLDLLRQQRRLEVGLDDHLDLQLGPADLSNERDDAERQRNVFGRSVSEKKIGKDFARCRGNLAPFSFLHDAGWKQTCLRSLPL